MICTFAADFINFINSIISIIQTVGGKIFNTIDYLNCVVNQLPDLNIAFTQPVPNFCIHLTICSCCVPGLGACPGGAVFNVFFDNSCSGWYIGIPDLVSWLIAVVNEINVMLYNMFNPGGLCYPLAPHKRAEPVVVNYDMPELRRLARLARPMLSALKSGKMNSISSPISPDVSNYDSPSFEWNMDNMDPNSQCRYMYDIIQRTKDNDLKHFVATHLQSCVMSEAIGGFFNSKIGTDIFYPTAFYDIGGAINTTKRMDDVFGPILRYQLSAFFKEMTWQEYVSAYNVTNNYTISLGQDLYEIREDVTGSFWRIWGEIKNYMNPIGSTQTSDEFWNTTVNLFRFVKRFAWDVWMNQGGLVDLFRQGLTNYQAKRDVRPEKPPAEWDNMIEYLNKHPMMELKANATIKIHGYMNRFKKWFAEKAEAKTPRVQKNRRIAFEMFDRISESVQRGQIRAARKVSESKRWNQRTSHYHKLESSMLYKNQTAGTPEYEVARRTFKQEFDDHMKIINALRTRPKSTFFAKEDRVLAFKNEKHATLQRMAHADASALPYSAVRSMSIQSGQCTAGAIINGTSPEISQLCIPPLCIPGTTLCLNCSVLQALVDDIAQLICNCVAESEKVSEKKRLTPPAVFKKKTNIFFCKGINVTAIHNHSPQTSQPFSQTFPKPTIFQNVGDTTPSFVNLNQATLAMYGFIIQVDLFTVIQDLGNFFLNTNFSDPNSFYFWFDFLVACDFDTQTFCGTGVPGIGITKGFLYTLLAYIVITFAGVALFLPLLKSSSTYGLLSLGHSLQSAISSRRRACLLYLCA